MSQKYEAEIAEPFRGRTKDALAMIAGALLDVAAAIREHTAAQHGRKVTYSDDSLARY